MIAMCEHYPTSSSEMKVWNYYFPTSKSSPNFCVDGVPHSKAFWQSFKSACKSLRWPHFGSLGRPKSQTKAHKLGHLESWVSGVLYSLYSFLRVVPVEEFCSYLVVIFKVQCNITIVFSTILFSIYCRERNRWSEIINI